MLLVNTTCPDCSTVLQVVRELPEDLAEVLPDTCPGCARRWTASILTHRDKLGNIRFTAYLRPSPTQFPR